MNDGEERTLVVGDEERNGRRKRYEKTHRLTHGPAARDMPGRPRRTHPRRRARMARQSMHRVVKVGIGTGRGNWA